MLLQEIEKNISELSFQEKSYLALNLLNEIQSDIDFYNIEDFDQILISRSEADSSNFIDSKLVFKELNSKYL